MASPGVRSITALSFAAALFASAPHLLSAQDHLVIARRVLERIPLIDGHNDLAWEIRESAVAALSAGGAAAGAATYDLRARTPGHTDLERLRRGMVGGQFWSVYVGCDAAGAARVQLEQIAIARAVIDRYPEALRLATSAGELERVFRDRRIGSLLGMEGAHTLEGSIATMCAYRATGGSATSGSPTTARTSSRTPLWARGATVACRSRGRPSCASSTGWASSWTWRTPRRRRCATRSRFRRRRSSGSTPRLGRSSTIRVTSRMTCCVACRPTAAS